MHTLGSLFDGSGGFPLAASRAGITPIWASEIEPYPIAVTQAHFPSMRHYGDVCEIDGGKIEPVDVITFGSPCQDLSVCGRREGLSGSRSNLFFEAIRIIKEMRAATNDENPRYAIWENVLGSLTSNGGNDFSQVVNQFLELVDLGPVARPPFWKRAGIVVADRFSMSWRVLDAQFFGVPQRRRRIFVVVDFRGRSAPVLFMGGGGGERDII